MDEETIMTQTDDEMEIDLRVVLSDCWWGFVKFWWVCALLAMLLGGWKFYQEYIRYVPMYRTSATFTVQTLDLQIMRDSGISSYSFYYDSNTADQLADVFPYILSSDILRKRVAADLGTAGIPASVSATGLPGTNMITLTTTGTDPNMVYDVLLSVVRNYSSVAEYIVGRTKLVMISNPEIPSQPFNRLVWRNEVVKGVLLGCLIGLGWIVLYAVMRQTVRTKEDIRSVLHQKCLGVIPQVTFKKYRNKKINTSVLLNNPHIGNDFLESMRMLCSSLRHSLGDGSVVVVTSTAPGEGKSMTTVNLASVCGGRERRVLVIDCDLRNSGIVHLLRHVPQTKVEEVPGNYLISHVKKLHFDLLTFTNAGANGHWILREHYLRALLDALRERYDLILIDTPPCGIISDASVVAGLSDGVLYVVRQDTVLRSSICAAVDTLEATGVKILGCVLNGAAGGLGGYGENYSYGGYSKYYRSGYYSYGYGHKSGYGKTKADLFSAEEDPSKTS